MIRVEGRLNSTEVIDALTDLFILLGLPKYTRSDNGQTFIAQKVRDWIMTVGTKTVNVERGSSRESGYYKSFNLRMHDELLKSAIF